MATPIPHYKISYAQNFEDIFLAGILRNVANGFYVDVGANHAVLDSVTKIFYDKGWTGINVEPNSALHAELCLERPRDFNLNLGLSSQPGSLTFRSYQSLEGLSSFSRESQEALGASNPEAAYADSVVDVSCLANVLATHRPSGEIHFLKIDVEGLELEVLLGNDWKSYRPWLLCIERTENLPRRSAIAHFLEASSYSNVFFDGINDFHVAKEKLEVWQDFSYARDIIMNGVPVNYIFINCIAELARAEQAHAKPG